MEYVIPVAIGVFLGLLGKDAFDTATEYIARAYMTRRLQASKPQRPSNTHSSGNPDMR